METVIKTPVLIVGGGPVGLSMAIELGWRGIESILVDEGDGTIEHPRTGLIAMRTMELFRRWGLAQRVRDCGFPDDYELSMVFCTSLNGLLLDQEKYPSMRDAPTPPETPEKKQRCPQLWLQPILTDAGRAESKAKLLFKHRFESLQQDDQGVTAVVTNVDTGEQVTIRADYLLGCDGATSSVREQVGIKMEGKLLSYSVNVLIHAPDLVDQHKMGPAERYLFVGPEGTWGNLTVVDGNEIWRLTVLGSEEKMDLKNFDPAFWVRRAIGRDDVAFKVDSTIPWRRSEMLADHYYRGRVVLVGDAAARHSPLTDCGFGATLRSIDRVGDAFGAAILGGDELPDPVVDDRPVHAFTGALSALMASGLWP